MLKTSDPKHPRNWHQGLKREFKPEAKPAPEAVTRRRILEALRARRALEAQFSLA
ncbi:MAG: hypothetical protein LPH21_07410 [Shewanella sp.]|nr:hypothetical protein [Shewanella sp.]